MKVRQAHPADYGALEALGHTLHAKSDRAHLAFDFRGAREMFDRSLTRANVRTFIAEERGRIVGFAVGVEQRWPYLKAKYVTDLMLVSTHPGAGRALVRALIAWAKECGADEVLLAVSFGGKSRRAGPLYERQGMTFAGGMYSMKLEGNRYVGTR